MTHNTDKKLQHGAATETNTWIPLKEAAAFAQKHEVTLKRAINNEKLVGRKVGPGHNDSYEVTQASLEAWTGKTTSVEAVPAVAVPVEAVPVEAVPVEAAPVEAAPVEAVPVEAVPVEAAAAEGAASESGYTDEVHAATSKRATSKDKTKGKAVIPMEARQLRRWKNNMRCANQHQKLAMIRWLSARLTPKHKGRANKPHPRRVASPNNVKANKAAAAA